MQITLKNYPLYLIQIFSMLSYQDRMTRLKALSFVSRYWDTHLNYDVTFRIYQDYMEKIYMAKFSWDFAKVELRKSDRKKIVEYAEAHDNDLNYIFDLMAEDNIKIAINYSTDRSSYTVTITPNKDNEDFSGVSMVSWTNDPIEGLWMAGYKHEMICNRKDWREKSEDEVWG